MVTDYSKAAAMLVGMIYTAHPEWGEIVRRRLSHGETYESWRESFDANMGPIIQPVLELIKGRGVDTEALLRELYLESRRRAMQEVM